MKKKVFLSISSIILLASTQVSAFDCTPTVVETTASTTTQLKQTANQYQHRFRYRHRCMHGFRWRYRDANVTDMSFGSANGCSDDDFDFYYKTFGGFIKGSDQVSPIKMNPGQDDVYEDGFWYREGAFSSPVYYGDPENDGKRYSDDPNGAWPAWTWGSPEADPFVSAGGAGDNLGGAAGIGLGGFGMSDGNKIKADDSDTFYPLNFIEINNFPNSFGGSYASDVSWNVAIYDKDHNEVFKKNYTTTIYYWETKNFQYPKYGVICPRSSVDVGEVVNDTAYNASIHELASWWPTAGLDVDFIGDGVEDSTACADAIKFKDTNLTDTFTVKKSHDMMNRGHRYAYTNGHGHTYGFAYGGRGFGQGMEQEYELSFDGPYIYDDTKEGCPAVNEEGLPDTTEKWQAECFRKVDTLWADEKGKDEKGKTRAFMRMSIKKLKQDHCNIEKGWHHPKLPNCKTMREKQEHIINKMMEKCHTNKEETKKAMEGMSDCNFEG